MFKNKNSYFQIVKEKKLILKSINTDGTGARKLQLFVNGGNLISEKIMYNEPFRITGFDGKTVAITYRISDLKFFSD